MFNYKTSDAEIDKWHSLFENPYCELERVNGISTAENCGIYHEQHLTDEMDSVKQILIAFTIIRLSNIIKRWEKENTVMCKSAQNSTHPEVAAHNINYTIEGKTMAEADLARVKKKFNCFPSIEQLERWNKILKEPMEQLSPYRVEALKEQDAGNN